MRDADTVDVARTAWLPWACEESNVGTDASPDETRQALCRRLERDGWLPSPTGHFAVDVVLAREAEPRPTIVEGSGAFIVAAEKKMRAEVDAFAARFFELAPAIRVELLTKLAERCRPFPPLVHRLREWKRGMRVEIPRLGYDRPLLDLAEHLGQLFVLGPEERARRRRQPEERLTKSLPHWREAAARLKTHLPQVAALEPTLVDSLVTGKVRESRSFQERIAPRRYSLWESVRANVSSWFETATESRWVLGVVVALAIRGCYVVGSQPSGSSTPRYDPMKDPKILEIMRRPPPSTMPKLVIPNNAPGNQPAGARQSVNEPAGKEDDDPSGSSTLKRALELLKQNPPVATGTGPGASSSLNDEYHREMFRRGMVEEIRRRNAPSGAKSAYDAPVVPGPIPLPNPNGASPNRRNP